MKTLLSLPPNLVDCFHQIEKVSEDAWFCTSDPVGARLGSGGGTTWLLESCWQKEHNEPCFFLGCNIHRCFQTQAKCLANKHLD